MASLLFFRLASRPEEQRDPPRGFSAPPSWGTVAHPYGRAR